MSRHELELNKTEKGVLVLSAVDRERAATAYHEAGHAVVTWLSGHGLGETTIVLNEIEGSAGRVESNEYAEDLHNIFDLCPSPEAPGGYLMKIGPKETRQLTPDECHWLALRSKLYDTEFQEAEVMIATAGMIAQRKFDPDSVQHHHDEGDRNHARRTLSDLATRHGISVDEVWSKMTARTEALLEDPLVWKVVSAFAKALLKSKTLSGKQFLEIARNSVSSA